jgi:hypothetical protein
MSGGRVAIVFSIQLQLSYNHNDAFEPNSIPVPHSRLQYRSQSAELLPF